jgi:hypothetical protein
MGKPPASSGSIDFGGPQPTPRPRKKLEGFRCLACARELPPFEPKLEWLHSERSGELVTVEYFNCPFCAELTATLTQTVRSIPPYSGAGEPIWSVKRTILPVNRGRRALPAGVPEAIAQEYREASAVLEISPRASAAMSRRCLQSLLGDAGGATADRLDKAIDQVIAASVLPRHLAEELDAVREIGNFAAHPMKSLATGAVLDVEPGEAEWNLEVLEHLFDFFFVELPGRKVRRHALEEKLKEAGRKPLAGT